MKFIKIIPLFVFLCFSLPLIGEETEDQISVTEESLPRLPSPPSPPVEQDNSQVIIEEGRGLVIIGDSDEMMKGSRLTQFEGVKIIGLEIPGNVKKLKKKLFSIVWGETITWETVHEIQVIIADHYKKYHHPLVLVELPEQDVSSGVLQLIVLESRLGKVEVEGNEYVSSERLKGYIELTPGQTIDENVLLNDINFINRNPFRRVDVLYAPGAQEATTDIVLQTKDRRPYRFYTGAENTGVEPIGRGRWFVGVNWGNVFGLDHIFSYQFTASWNPHRFFAHTAEYLAPLPWHHILDVYGGYSEVHPKIHKPIRRNSGWSAQASLRYIIPLQIYRYFEHQITWGFDYKRTNNTFEFSDDFPRFGKNVNLTQLVAGYSGNYDRNTFRLDFNGDAYCSPGGWLPDQKNKDYESLRPGAKHSWVYFRGSFVYLQRLPLSFSYSLLVKGQVSSQNLLPSEQFGLGGYDTVRGYDQREVNKDGAILVSSEARSPALPFIKKWKDAVQFLVFLDYGWGSNHKALPGEPKTEYLLGTGPGIRYTIEPYLTARLDWGIKLHHKALYGGGNTMVHFAVTASY